MGVGAAEAVAHEPVDEVAATSLEASPVENHLVVARSPVGMIGVDQHIQPVTETGF